MDMQSLISLLKFVVDALRLLIEFVKLEHELNNEKGDHSH